MPFNEKRPRWDNEGVEIPLSKQQEGWLPVEKPPADWFNWLFNRTYKVLLELRQKVAFKADVGDMSSVPTTAKDAAGAITELHTSIKNLDVTVGDGSITDAKIGNRTINDTVVASAGADTPTRLWSKLAYMIKGMSGTANWWTLPSMTITAIIEALGNKANLASPTFTGTPAGPTAAAGTKTKQFATTEFVMNEVSNMLEPSTTPTIKTVTCTAANSEYSATIPNAKKFTVSLRDYDENVMMDYTMTSGDPLTFKMKGNMVWSEDNLKLDSSKSLYFKSSVAGKIVQVMYWT